MAVEKNITQKKGAGEAISSSLYILLRLVRRISSWQVGGQKSYETA